MINQTQASPFRILAIAPASRGLGFAVIEGKEKLVNWGVKGIKKNKNADSLQKLKELIEEYRPHMLIFENYSAKGSRRSPRVRKLGQEILVMARAQKIKVKLFSRKEVMESFFQDRKATKDALAGILAKKFPEELGNRLPRKRRAWDSEHSRMPFFEAVSLAMAFRMRGKSA